MKPRSANAPRQQAPFWPIEGAVPILRNKPIPIGQLSYDGPEFTQTSDVECPFRGWMCATRSKRVVICSRRFFRIYAASIAGLQHGRTLPFAEGRRRSMKSAAFGITLKLMVVDGHPTLRQGKAEIVEVKTK